MIALFNHDRSRQLAWVIAVALAQLGATVTVAGTLHQPGHGAWRIAAVAALAGFVCEVLLRRLSEGLGLAYVSAVREALFRHLMRVDPAVIAQRRHGAMLQSFVGDLTALRQWVAEGVMRAIVAVTALCGLLTWLCLAAPRLGLVAVAIVAVSLASGLAMMRHLSRAVQQVRRERGRVSAFASERLAASVTVLACARAGSEARRLDRRVARLNRASLRRAWLTGLLRALPHLAATCIVIAAVLIGNPAGSGGIGGLVLVIGIIGLALRDLARAAELVVPGRISRRRITKLLGLPGLSLPIAGAWQRGEARKLVLEGLVVAHGATPLSTTLGQGDVVLVEGDHRLVQGLFAVLVGLASPVAGTVRWNGSNLCARRPAQRRRIVGLASADLPVLPGSNGLNLRYRAPGSTEREQAELARVWNIDPLGHGADPHRLALVRALLGRPPVLLLAPDDRTLADADACRLADAIADWPGIVLLTSYNPLLVGTTRQRWLLSTDGQASGTGQIARITPRKERAA